jgi:hypothetical protein
MLACLRNSSELRAPQSETLLEACKEFVSKNCFFFRIPSYTRFQAWLPKKMHHPISRPVCKSSHHRSRTRMSDEVSTITAHSDTTVVVANSRTTGTKVAETLEPIRSITTTESRWTTASLHQLDTAVEVARDLEAPVAITTTTQLPRVGESQSETTSTGRPLSSSSSHSTLITTTKGRSYRDRMPIPLSLNRENW